jgi:hypothetical protein
MNTSELQQLPAQACRTAAVAMLAVALAGACKPKEDAMPHNSIQPESGANNDLPTNPVVTRKLFLQWRTPRFGSANPERMNNPVWEWLVKSRLSAWAATQRLQGPSAMKAGPGWCFDRFGQSSTVLPDGREVLVGGEHEDSYDPDFYIYNDLVVRHPNGGIDIFGYPRQVFPPTDSHSATLVSNCIVLIGGLGYPDDRRPGTSPVLVLDLGTFRITRVKTSGTPPGWIHRHKATLSADGSSILVVGGTLDRGDKDQGLVENIDDWRLHLADWRWERVAERRWLRWEVRRKDGELSHLWGFQFAAMAKAFTNANDELARMQKQLGIPSLEGVFGRAPDQNLLARLYRPPVDHEELPASAEEHQVHRIKVQGVVVRYVQGMDSVQMTVEGELPQPVTSALTRDLLDKVSKLENAPCKLIKL